MSVINKMLRDLDARRADGALPDLPRQARSAAMQGTVSVGARERARSAWLRRLLVVMVLAVAALAVWYGLAMQIPVPAVAALPQAAEPAVALPQAAASDAMAAAATPNLPQSLPTAVPPASLVIEPTAKAPVPATRPPAGKVVAGRDTTRAQRVAPPAPAASPHGVGSERPVAAVVPPVVAGMAPPPAQPQPAAAPPVSAAAPVAGPAPLPAATVQGRQSVLQETLAQAQGLWTAGSREAAVDLLREAVGVAARAPATENDTQALAVLVRELTRMEMAQGRSAVALDLLVRLEPSLSGQADLWAVRGNAAQRLGRHAESVQAYQRALQLRPGEQRWLLGAAVSLAALGQAEAAAQQAEQARALGPVSPEVLTYLRQAGVPLR